MITLIAALSAHAQVFDGAGLESVDAPWELAPPSGELDLDPVVNGEPADDGAWEDAVGIVMYGSYVGCTGTLIHPKVVLTAGHCVGAITDVVIGSTDWTRNGEMIGVERTIEYPNSQGSYDAAVLLLEKKATGFDPRPIAMECILDKYLEDGAEVAVVGFGGTRIDGGGSNSRLNEGYTYVQDSDGDSSSIDGIYTGFNPSISPGGEIGAGGNEVDSCFGDSGGPLYLLTPEGDFLVGLTSRSYAGVPWDAPCLYGGIYVRPDAILDWIEEETGKTLTTPRCNERPTATVSPIIVSSGAQGTSRVVVDDPDGKADKASIAIAVDPASGTVELGDDGEVVYTSAPGFVGSDSFVVAVTDKGSENRYPRSGTPITIEVEVPVTVSAAPAGGTGATGTDLTLGEGSGGCACDGVGGTSGWAMLLPLVDLVRRRR